jgi:O-antigen/teichoic acid export membrane protein
MTEAGSGPDPGGDVLDTAEAGRRVLVGGAVRIAGYGVGLIASILAAAVVIRHLGTVDLGRFNTVIALVTGLQIVTDLGMTSLGVREYSQRTGDDRDRFMRVLLGMRLVTTALLLVVVTVVAVVLGYDHAMIVGTVLLGISASISALNSTVGIPLAAEIRMGVVTAIDVARQVGIGIGYVLLTFTSAGIVAFLGISIPVYLLVLLATYAFVRGSVPLRPIIQPRAWGDLIRPTFAFALASAAGSIYVYGAMVLTELVVNDVQTSLFAAAFRVYIVVSAFPVLLVTTALPVLSRAARDDHERLGYASRLLVEGTALLGGATLITLVLGARPIMSALAGAGFSGAVPVLRIQGTALAITFVIAALGFTLIALHRHRAIIVCNLLALSVSGTTVLTLGHTHGAEGAAVGVLLGELTLATSYTVALVRGTPSMKPDVRGIARAAPPLAIALACWFLPISPILSTAIALVLYCAGLIVVRALPEELIVVLPGPFARLLGSHR